jgi:hypothetical protein
MSPPPYSLTANLDRFQKNCRLTLEIDGDKMPLSFDDAIEFKIEIGQLLVTEAPSARDIHGTLEKWQVKFSPNKGGFAIEIRHPLYSTRALMLNARQAENFSEQLQHFIDAAGQRA